MSIVLCTLALNEMQWLPMLVKQHSAWKDLRAWIFVESADRVYADTSPDMVSPEGLSVDGTTEFLRDLAKRDPRVIHIEHGFSTHADPAQGKCESRQRYLDAAEAYTPDFLLVLDADEFYTHETQAILEKRMKNASRLAYTGYCFKQRQIWRPPTRAGMPLFSHEVIGGFWAIPHCRGWRWQPGLRYTGNHNIPSINGRQLDRRMKHFYDVPGEPECIHMGFAASLKARQAKHAYYAARGEGKTDHRGWYVESRQAWQTWHPNTELPHDAKVIPYTGAVPECFLEDAEA